MRGGRYVLVAGVHNSGQCCNCGGVGQVEGGEQYRIVSWFGDVAGLCECPSG